MPEFLEQAAEAAVGSDYGPAGGKFASKDARVSHTHSPSPSTLMHTCLSVNVWSALNRKISCLVKTLSLYSITNCHCALLLATILTRVSLSLLLCPPHHSSGEGVEEEGEEEEEVVLVATLAARDLEEEEVVGVDLGVATVRLRRQEEEETKRTSGRTDNLTSTAGSLSLDSQYNSKMNFKIMSRLPGTYHVIPACTVIYPSQCYCINTLGPTRSAAHHSFTINHHDYSRGRKAPVSAAASNIGPQLKLMVLLLWLLPWQQFVMMPLSFR